MRGIATWQTSRAVEENDPDKPNISTPQTPTSFGGLQLEGFFVLRKVAMSYQNIKSTGSFEERRNARRVRILALATKVFFHRALLGPDNDSKPKFIYISKLENLAGSDIQLFEMLKTMAVEEYDLQLRV